MGTTTDEHPETEIDEFRRRLRHNLATAKEILATPGFGVGETTIGAELEFSLINWDAEAALVNRQVLANMSDPRLTVELDRFNLEFNADPVPLAGTPFKALGDQFSSALESVNSAAAPLGACSIPIGTLPSLELDLLTGDAVMTDLPRYRALELALRSFRGRPFELNIDGKDPLAIQCEGVTLEGANTSLQIHLRVEPSQFAATYNAAQLATPIALALSGNSPVFCGHRLWDETRIAIFKQAIDIRDPKDRKRPPRVGFGHGWMRKSVHELLSEAVYLHEPLVPVLSRESADEDLRELQVHLGTIWRWNRPVFDTSAQHLRIELRALPSGPTVIDMMASSAFYVGLILGLRDRIDDLVTAIPFEYVRTSFYRAAQHGLDATVAWPADQAPSPQFLRAKELALRLIPLARHGLTLAGLEQSRIDEHLEIIRERVETNRTGARWQLDELELLVGQTATRKQALQALTLSYLSKANRGDPVHTWAVGV